MYEAVGSSLSTDKRKTVIDVTGSDVLGASVSGHLTCSEQYCLRWSSDLNMTTQTMTQVSHLDFFLSLNPSGGLTHTLAKLRITELNRPWKEARQELSVDLQTYNPSSEEAESREPLAYQSVSLAYWSS